MYENQHPITRCCRVSAPLHLLIGSVCFEKLLFLVAEYYNADTQLTNPTQQQAF